MMVQPIDATVFQLPDGSFRVWYKDESRGSVTMMAGSSDLVTWFTSDSAAVGGAAHEGPKVFRFNNYYWMLTDEWQGMRVYRSDDLTRWEKQGLILDKPSNRPDDRPSGAHGDVVVTNGRAYVFYFTHPGRQKHGEPLPDANGAGFHNNHRSSIQVAPLIYQNGTLIAPRDKPFDYRLDAPHSDESHAHP